MGVRTRQELLLSSMTSITRTSLYEIQDLLTKINECCELNVRFNDESILVNRYVSKDCNIKYCNKLDRLIMIMIMILLSFTVVGIIVPILYIDNPANFTHTRLNLYYNKKNRDSVEQIYRYFANYHNSKYHLTVNIYSESVLQ